jgi:hypothetical protein
MVAVAVIALGFSGLLWLGQRAEDFRSISIGHATRFDAALRQNGGVVTLQADHHRRMSEKYDRAALLPWLPVAPDPPVPE